MKRINGMRLYRGLSKKYRPGEVGKRQQGRLSGTDFSDCPYLALKFARGTRGSVLVLDVLEDVMDLETAKRVRVTEELYSLDGKGPKRFIVWGRFDDLLVAEIPAKELRAHVRRKGIVTLGDDDKSRILEDYIDRWINEQTRVSQDLDRAMRGN
ncbi:MAG: hypothetical protein HY717_04250 [Planctomycetes bacterium]|nr:hypothetical protein [Planctomycetota bacterium]